MRKKLLCGLAFVATMGLPVAAHASLQTLSSLFVFGDSLSDGGNSGLVSQAATGGTVTFPPPPYYNGQYSNGPVAVEYLWNSYNPGDTSFKPSLAGGTNYAIGGATTGLASFNSITPSVPPPLQPAYSNLGNNWQLNTFAAQAPVFDPVSSLFVVWLFPNDLFYYQATGMTPGTAAGAPGFGPAGVDQLIGNGIKNIVDTVLFLESKGAQHFLVPNLVDISKSPDGKGDPTLAALAQAFNFNLAQALTTLDAALTSVEIVQFDTYGALNDVIGDPGAYGIKNTDQQCIQNYAACAADNFQWVFWDGSHPTTYTHSILGAEFRAAVPEPESILLLAIGLLGIFVTRRRAV